MPDFSKKIHIMHLTTDSAIGGTEKMIAEIASSLSKERFESTVVTLKAAGPLEDICAKKNIRYISLNMKSKLDFMVVFRLFKVINNNKIHILHTYLFHANILGRIVGRLAKVPIIFSGQRNIDLWRKKYHNLIDRLTAKFCCKIISNSLAGKDFLIKEVGIPEDKLLVVPNGIDVKDSIQVVQREDKSVSIVVVASLTLKKGHLYLFKAFQKLLYVNKDIYLTVIGDGPLRKELEELSHSLKIYRNVKFSGFQDNIEKYFEQADIFVLPSLWEGMPVALMEAMACGLPCIASNVGGVGELIDNNVNGILIEPKDIDALYSSMLRLISDSAERNNLGINARQKILDYYSKKAMISKLEEIYIGVN